MLYTLGNLLGYTELIKILSPVQILVQKKTKKNQNQNMAGSFFKIEMKISFFLQYMCFKTVP